MPHRCFQIGTADYFIEVDAGAGSKQIYGEQRHSQVTGIARHLEEIFFLPMSGVAHPHDHRRLMKGGGGRQKIALQRMAFQPGNLDDLAGGSHMFDVAAGAASHGSERRLLFRVGGV